MAASTSPLRADQFLDLTGGAWSTKARLIGDEDPDEWDLPLSQRECRRATCEKWEAKFDGTEDALDARLVMATARLIKRL